MPTSIKDQDYAIRDFDKLLKACKAVGVKAKTLQEEIHRCVTSSGWHYSEHRNATVFNPIVNALPDGVRVERIKDYCNFHYGVVWNEADSTFKKDKDWTGEIFAMTDEKGKVILADGKPIMDIGFYRENKWFDHKVERLSPDMLIKKAIEALTKKMQGNPEIVKTQRVGAMGAAYDLVNTMNDMGLTATPATQPKKSKKVA